MIDVILPAYDTPRGDLTPLVLSAMADGATSHAHGADQIVLVFEDEAKADAFETAIAPYLNPKT